MAAVRTWDWRVIPVAGVTALVVWILVRNLAGAQEFADAFANARWEYGAASVGLLFVCQIVAAHRWMLILDALGHPIPFGRAARAMLATWPMALLAPARASDLLRALAIADLCPPLRGAGSVVAEKAIDVQSLCLLAIVGSIAYGVPLVAVLAAGMLGARDLVWAWCSPRRDRATYLRAKPAKLQEVLVAFRRCCIEPAPRVVAYSLRSWIAGPPALQ